MPYCTQMHALHTREEAMTTHTLPFGRHKGAALANVPTPHLAWAIRTVRLSSGLRAAVRTELTSRPDCPSDLPDEPAPRTPQCRRCGGVELRLAWQGLSRGTGRVIRGDCRRCGQFVLFVEQTPENVALADGAPDEPAPRPAETFELQLVAQPGPVPATVRLKQVVKGLLRQHGFRLTSCREVK
jgi:hypothetical protein